MNRTHHLDNPHIVKWTISPDSLLSSIGDFTKQSQFSLFSIEKRKMQNKAILNKYFTYNDLVTDIQKNKTKPISRFSIKKQGLPKKQSQFSSVALCAPLWQEKSKQTQNITSVSSVPLCGKKTKQTQNITSVSSVALCGKKKQNKPKPEPACGELVEPWQKNETNPKMENAA